MVEQQNEDDATTGTPPNGDQLIKIKEVILLVEMFGEQLENMIKREEDDDDEDEPFVYEQPIPCPIGTYCREGASTSITFVGDYATPQPCYDGFFW